MEWKVIEIIVLACYFLALFALIYWFLYFLENKKRMKKELAGDTPVLKRFPLVSIVVPAWNEEEHVIKTLKSLLNLNYPDEKLEIIVVNDCSTDRTKEIAEKFIKNYRKQYSRHIAIRLINQKKNRGKAEALNTALDICKGEFFVCIDADSTVDKDALMHIMDMFEKDKDLAIVTPAMKVDNPRTLLQKFQKIEYMASILMIKLMSYMDCNFVAPGPFSTYKILVLRKLGKFDGKHNLEDQEIAWRAQKKHYKIRQCSKAYVYTVAPHNLKKLSRQRTRWYRGSMLTMYDYKHMIFDRKYGDFGMFQIPLMLTYYLLAIASVFLLSYYTLKFIFKQIHNLILVRFDIITLLKDIHFTFNILDVEITTSWLLYIMLFLSITLLYFAIQFNSENADKYKSAVVLYFFIFYIILGVILIKSIGELVFRRKQKW